MGHIEAGAHRGDPVCISGLVRIDSMELGKKALD